ncbi:MAG: hypothetical protein EON47_08675 [Acetobacteraceae bacterium]|nr:MAG: hypothetical protein EON47_08675 [Acetobacteraceae bacterium]
MTEPNPAPAAPDVTPHADAGWNPPPARAVRLHAASSAAWCLLPFAGLASVLHGAGALAGRGRIGIALSVALLVLLLGGWLGARLRHQRWKLDAEGLWLRQGRTWRRETRVPISRVQHIDLKHGPLERRFGLATLVVHTAAVHLGGVTVRGLAEADAGRMRDALARQLDDAGDAL